VPWDGYLKYFKPSERFVEERRKLYASSLISRFSSHNLVDLEQRIEENLHEPCVDDDQEATASGYGIKQGLLKRSNRQDNDSIL